MRTDGVRTVGEVVAAAPRAARVFERVGIDYCCGGRKGLAAACAQAGVALEDVVAAIEAEGSASSGAEVDWRATPLDALIDHIEATHHVFTRSELARAEGLAAKVRRAHGEAHPEVLAALETFEALRDELLPHLLREEQVLFPYVRGLATGSRGRAPFPSVQMPIRMMDAQHEVAGDLLKRLRAQTHGYVAPAHACGTWRALWESLATLELDLHQHIHLESNVLFPRAVAAEAAA